MPDDPRSKLIQNVPAELRASCRWVLYCICDTVENGKKRERAKVPFDPKTGREASHSNPNTWSSFEVAIAAHESHLSLHPNLDKVTRLYEDERGLGLVIGPPFIGVDLDKCRDPKSGELTPEAEDLVEQLDTFCEPSPSGTGVHLWLHGNPPYPEGHRKDSIEVYSRNRYLTMTGDGVNREIRHCSDGEIAALYQRVREGRPKVVPCGSDKLQQYLTTLDFPEMNQDKSRAVQSLLSQLFYEYGPENAAQVEEKFKTSKLYLETHWGTKWERLRESELAEAAKFVQDHPHRKAKKQYQRRGRWKKLSDEEEEVLTWLWDCKVPLGNVTIFAGDPGVGKSLMALDLAGRGSTGTDFLDGKSSTGKFKTLILADEDDHKTIVKPRILAAGADPSMIESLDFVEQIDEQGEVIGLQMACLESDVAILREKIKSDPEIKLVIIDPISNYMGSKSLFRDQELRAVLMPLAKLAQETGVAIVVILHNSKQTGRTALQKIAASLGGVGTARIAWTFTVTADDRRLMLLAKKNLGDFPGIEFTTESVNLEIKGKNTSQAVMKYVGESKEKVDTVMARQENPETRAESQSEKLVRERLPADGQWHPADPIIKELSLSDNQRVKLRQELGIETRNQGGSWYWKWKQKPGAGQPLPLGEKGDQF